MSGLGLNETTVNIKTDNVHFKYKLLIKAYRMSHYGQHDFKVLMI